VPLPDLPELLQPFGWLLGSWRGEGVGGYPTLGEDFRYGEEMTFAALAPKPVIAFESRSWSVEDNRPLARSSGFWRPTSATEVEVVLAHASGLVEILYGELVEGANGVHLALVSDVIGHSSSAKQVDKDSRLFAVRGGKLMYAMEMAIPGQGLAPHLSAALDRVEP
jgi:hypothetical protein